MSYTNWLTIGKSFWPITSKVTDFIRYEGNERPSSRFVNQNIPTDNWKAVLAS